MSVTGIAGPLVVFGQVPAPSGFPGAAQDNDAHWSPSMFSMGAGILDFRYPYTYVPGNSQAAARGWEGFTNINIVDQVPSTLTTTAIAAAQVPVAGTRLTLVSSSGAGITVGTTVTRADTGVAVANCLAIDGVMTPINLTPTQNGGAGNQLWNPQNAIARTVQIQSVGNDSAATAVVRGFDVYSYPVTETITLTNASTATGKKAFKYILSVTPAGTLSGSNISVGQSDVYGFMLRVDLYQFVTIYWPDTTIISSNTGFTAAVTTTATATTGDVRGTYALQVASNAVRRLVMFTSPRPTNMGTATGLTGVTQFFDF